MRILVDLTVLELPATGVAKVLTGLYAAIAADFPEITISGIHRRRLAAPLPPGIQARRVGRGLPRQAWRRFAIPYAARFSEGAILHFPWNGEVPSMVQNRLVITTLHDVLPLTIPGFFPNEVSTEKYRQQKQADADRSSVIVTDSEFSKKEIVKHLRLSREPVVVPCATSIGEFRREITPSDKPYFLYVGGLDPRKSVDVLVRVFIQLRREGIIRSRLTVVGSTRHAPPGLIKSLEDGQRQGYIEIRGYVDDIELAGLYSGALALVYPSQYEGFGMPPLEAMTMGCPVVIPRASSLPEVCAEAAYYVEPSGELSLSQAILEIERNPGLRSQLRDAGIKRASLFSWTKAATAFVQIIQDLSQKD